MRKLLLVALVLGFYITGNAQGTGEPVSVAIKPVGDLKVAEGVKPMPSQARYIGFRNTPSLDPAWQPVLSTVISKNESEYKQLLKKIKAEKAKLKQATTVPEVAAKSTAGEPIVSTNFVGLNSGGFNTPMDHTVAIGDNGIIVAMVNSRVAYYNSTGTQTYINSIAGLVNDNSLSNNMCDPKVIWSPVDDRFIMFVQTCDAQSSTSAIVLGFSKTSNPADGWHFYAFNGNPLNDGSWFDYPKIAISTDEVFVSGNLFYEGSNNFNTSVVYQIQKTPCLSGQNTGVQFWANLPGSPFTVLPVSWGQNNAYGPGIYMVSTAPGGANGIYLYAIDNNMASSNEQLLSGTVSTTPYSPAADAPQPGPKDLDVGDCRALDGFYLDNTIHFVFNCDAGSGWNGINYNRLVLTQSSTTNTSYVYGQAGTADLCYPAVASISNSTTDKSVVIVCNRVAASVNPEMRVIGVSNGGTWSNSVLVKAGDGPINHGSSSSTERWGDYSGIGRKFNDNPPSVWVAAGYGTSQQYWGTWIAKITGTPVSVAGVEKEETSARIYPNPVVSTCYIEFDLTEPQPLSVVVSDAQGRLVKDLFKGEAQKGRNVFSFNKASLAAGTYFVQIKGRNNIIKNEKIVIAD
jgi:hypothetical protein